MMRLFLISLGVTCLASVILFLYFRNRVGRMEQKVDLMFQLIQEYEQSKNIEAAQTFKPIPVNNTMQRGGSSAHDDLISVSDDDEDERDTDSEEVSDNEEEDEVEEELLQIQESVESWRLNKGYEINDIEVAKKREELIKNKNPFADLEDVLIAIDHVKNLVGDDFIGFGSDFDGLGDSLPNNLKNVSYYPMILEGLLNRGYSKESIEKICYKNLFRVWDTNLQNHQT